MNRTFKVILDGRIRAVLRPSEALCRSAWSYARLTQTPPLRWHKASPEQIQIGERKGGEQSRGVLRQASIANLAEAPQTLDHEKCMFTSSAGGRALSINCSLVQTQRPLVRPPIDPISNTFAERCAAVLLAPIGLIAEDRPLTPMQQLRHLADVGTVGGRCDQAVHDAARVGPHVRLHAKVPVLALKGLMHLRVSRLIGVLGRGGRRNDGRIHVSPTGI